VRWLIIVCAAAVACGASGPDRPREVRASAEGGFVDVAWSAAPGASAYRVQLADLETRRPLSDAMVVRGTSARLRGVFSKTAGVWVDAIPGGRAIATVTAGGQGGTAAPWQIFGPQDFRGGVLTADFPSVPPGERLGVLLINAGGRDDAQAQVEVSGVAVIQDSPPPRQTQAALLAATRPPALHAPEQEALEAAPPEPAGLDAHRSFCVVPGLDFSKHIRKPATRVALTAHGAIYVDDEDLSHYEAPDIDALARAFEERVWPSDVAAFGAPTDVDQNGRILVLLTHELGAHLNGGWLIGYFGNGDLLRARDLSPGCSGSGSNHGEIVFLNDVRNGAANGWSAQELFSSVYPATLAHEIQHLLNLGHRCVEQKCAGAEETWINEALSKLAEDLAGYGWNGATGRSEGAAYLSRSEGALRGYDGRSLTHWEGDPIGNYQGAHSFLRFFADRLGVGVAGEVALGAGGRQGLEDALGRPLSRAMAEWATALLVSNEGDAAYSFSGGAWSPLHQRLRHLDSRSPGLVSMRADGIAAIVSGAGQGAPARVTVRSAEASPPFVVVLRAPGDLPAR
jgi:hypothetical protein